MRKFHTQIILVSGQMVPNVTPVMDNAIRPEKVILCTSNAMDQTGRELSDFFKTKKIQVELFELCNAYDLKELKNKFLDLATQFSDTDQVAINLTGGTKLMTIAAQLVFGDEFHCFYVIPNEDSIIMLSDSGHEKYEIQDKLNLTDYFTIHGYNVESSKKISSISSKDRILFKSLLSNYDKYNASLGTLNYLAAKAEDAYSLKVRQEIDERYWDILQLFAEHGAISYYDDKKIEFMDKASRDFCKGFWLESATYQAMQQVNDEIGLQDFACSVNISSHNGTKNELDAAFLYNNNLYIIECKTARMDTKGSDVLYKLDTIKDYAGMLTKPIIATFKPLSGYDRRRAADLKIKLIEGTALKNLSKNIIKFIQTGK